MSVAPGPRSQPLIASCRGPIRWAGQGWLLTPLGVMSQPTLWGHASRVPGRGWRGAVPPSTPRRSALRRGWLNNGQYPSFPVARPFRESHIVRGPYQSASAHVVTSMHRSGYYRLERQLPGGIRTRQESAPFHGARKDSSKLTGTSGNNRNMWPYNMLSFTTVRPIPLQVYKCERDFSGPNGRAADLRTEFLANQPALRPGTITLIVLPLRRCRPAPSRRDSSSDRTQGHRTIRMEQRPLLSKSHANRRSFEIRLSGSYTMNMIWALSGYLVRSAAMLSDAFDGEVCSRTYLASMRRSEFVTV